jgi:hypothetical protein
LCKDKPDNKCALLRSKLKNNPPKNWHPRIEKSKKWETGEIRRVVQALEVLPDNLKAMTKAIYRMDSSMFGDNPGRETEEGIALYDSAFGQKYILGNVVAHELSHSWFKKLSQTELTSFLKAAQWRKETASSLFRVGRPKELFLNDHGRESPGEDFAIDVEYYLFYPEQLKRVTPRVYEWLGDQYGSWLRLKDLKGEERCGISTYFSRFLV